MSDIIKWLGEGTRERAAYERLISRRSANLDLTSAQLADVVVLAESAAEMTKKYISLISTDPEPPDGDTKQNLAFYKAMAKFGVSVATLTADDQQAILARIEAIEYTQMHGAKLYADQVRTIHALLKDKRK